jgi:effector-binding domain-containing protein
MAVTAPTANVPTLTDAPRRHVLYQHFIVPHERIGETIRSGFAALYARIGDAGVVPAGPPFVVYLTAAPPWEIDVCAPVARDTAPSADIMYREMPASRVVSLLHVGPYENLGRAYDDVQAFIRDNALVADGPPREYYLSPPDTPADQIQTIVEWPIR